MGYEMREAPYEANRMNGRRVGDDIEPHLYEPGDYGRWNGTWYCKTPSNAEGNSFLGNLSGHDVREHEDGTLTVSPSILVSEGRADREVWHGFLERGIWRTA
jgi:hypothetical protein